MIKEPPNPPNRLDRSAPLGAIVRSLGGAQKSNRGAPAYSRWINRPLGRRFAAVSFKVGRTPNQVTALSAVFTFGGILCIALLRPDPYVGPLIAVLLVTGYGLDAADGQLARLRGGGTAAGEWLDHVIDCLKCVSIHAAVLVAWFRYFDQPDWTLLIPLFYGVEAATFFFAIVLTEQLRKQAGLTSKSAMPESKRPTALRSIIALPADYGLLCLTFFLWGWHLGFAWVYGLLMVCNVVLLSGACVNWFRQLRSMGV